MKGRNISSCIGALCGPRGQAYIKEKGQPLSTTK